MKAALIVIALLIVGFFAFGFVKSNTPEGRARADDREKIEICWEQYERKSLSDIEKRVVASICERQESEFQQRHGVKP